ncbi:uncharacterized protein LOC111370367 [Olea europaea var. sylvestris]|uniref:uncharacterized protein LOC111370367 n=1 Tax=Olea europaea var. sylvestris TaxID=158386 RepID=UPI000C1CF520|nr:uncharacterized protein LOC111370367 [Olea europaea var. sylvestris]
MAGRRELGFPKMNAVSLKEQLVRTTLRNVRSQGHMYVELREDGKKLLFFCTLCLAPCYSDAILFDHLKGSLHSERLAAAKSTLLKPNPWPFNDGVFFFHDDSSEQDKSLLVSTSERFKLLDTHHVDEDSLPIVSFDENLGRNDVSHVGEDDMGCDDSSHDQNLNGNGSDLVIPGVLQKEEVCDLVVRQMGVGRIAARISEKDGVSNEICKIWCEWLVNKDSANEDTDLVLEHDFAVVAFAYNYNLGRKALLGDIRYLLPSSHHSEAADSGSSRSKKRKSFSDPEDVSEGLSNQNDSSGEESQSSNNPNSKFLLAGNDDQLVQSRIIVSKTMRKELRRQHNVASERLCDICQQKMLPGKDVAALLNRKTGRLVCSSRNLTGAFHVFHISCLIHWILLCETEIYANRSVAPQAKRKSRRKVRGKDGETEKKDEIKASSKQIYSVFCPECQGTGININGEEREKPTIPLSEMFKYKIKLSDAHKAWMKHPEALQNCSMGFHFPRQSEDICQENVVSLKLLRFYRVNE